jgi:hypothetical protein
MFDFDHAVFERLLGRRLGRIVLLTNRMDWTSLRRTAVSAVSALTLR